MTMSCPVDCLRTVFTGDSHPTPQVEEDAIDMSIEVSAAGRIACIDVSIDGSPIPVTCLGLSVDCHDVCFFLRCLLSYRSSWCACILFFCDACCRVDCHIDCLIFCPVCFRSALQAPPYLRRISPVEWEVHPGIVPNMRVKGAVYVNDALAPLLFSELGAAAARGGSGGGFLPAIHQLANVAALPGIVGR